MSDPLRVCLVSASGQNVFFAEILAAFGAALTEHGLAVEESTDCFPPAADDLVTLFVPHEYHPMVGERAHPSAAQLRRSVAVCTEQPGTHWFELGREIATGAGAVVDINTLGAEELNRRGVAAHHVPLGYVPAWDRWRRRQRPRSVDVAFLGAHTDRRAGALARCAPVLGRRSSAIHVVETVQPHVAGSPHFFEGERKWELMADSTAILNIHRDELPYMEWHRVIGAILNGCVVVSEHSIGTEPLVPGEHFVSAGLDDLPWVLDGLLGDPARIEAIRNAAYDLVKQEMPESAMATSLLTAIERAVANPLPAADSGRGRLSEDVVETFGPRCEQPRVSVLLAVHDREDHVDEALRSVALAEVGEVEVIAVDDASADGTVGAIRRASEEIPWLPVTLVQRGHCRGLPAARKLALGHARADLVLVLGGGDALLPQGLPRLVEALDESPDAAFAHGLVECFDASGSPGLLNWTDRDREWARSGNGFKELALFRRAALEEADGDPVGVRVANFVARRREAASGATAQQVPEPT